MRRDGRQLVTIRGSDDGQSAVLGVVLMMGFVAAAAVSVFVLGTATVGETQDTAQEQQVENTFREFNKDVASVAYGRQKYRSMQFDIEDQTAAFRQEDTGTIRVEVAGEEKVNRSVGALVYENKGETIAYQAGGVWRGTGKDSRMISRPPVEYQNGSLTFPIPALDGDEQIQAGKLDINKRKTESPINDDSYIKGKLVTLHITSEYYMGWAEYFLKQTNDVAVEVNHSPPGPKGTVTVKLGKPIANGDFENGVFATGGDEGDIYVDNNNTDDNLSATGEINGSDGDENIESNLFILDPAIERKIENAREVVNNSSDDSIEYLDPEGGETVSEGTYFVNKTIAYDDDTENLDVNLGSGNVTLILDDDIRLRGGNISVDPEGTENSLYIYTSGNYSQKHGHGGASKDQGAEHLQIYGTSDMLVAITGGSKTQFVGTIYAPRNEPVLDPSGEDGEENPVAPSGSGSQCDGWDMCISAGSSGFLGAIVGGPTYMGQATSVDYDESLGTLEPTLQLEDGVLPPPITFLKVSVHTVAVNNSGANNIQPADGFGSPASVTLPSTPSTSGFASTTGTASPVVVPAARSATPLQ